MNNSGLPTPSSSSTGGTPSIPNGTSVASEARAQPQPQPQLPHQQAYNLPPQTASGPSLNALNSIARENAGLGFGYGFQGPPAQTWNAGFPAQHHVPNAPQNYNQWPAYGQHFPAQHYNGGYAGHHAHNAAPFSASYRGPQVNAPPAPTAQVPHRQQEQVLPNAALPRPATQEHVPRIPGAANLYMPFVNQDARQAPPAHWPPPVPFAGPPYHHQQHVQQAVPQAPYHQQHVQQAMPQVPYQQQQVQWAMPQVPYQYQQQQIQQAMPQVPGPVEGGSKRMSKRKAVDDDDTTQSRKKRTPPEDDPDFLAVTDDDGTPRWKCLRPACAHVQPMLTISVYKHVTATISHQKDSAESRSGIVCPACGTSFLRQDALTRHMPSGKCKRNKEKAQKNAQPSSQALWNGTFAAAPSSSGPAPNSVAQQTPLLPVAGPGIIQAAGNITFGATIPIAMPQQEFTFRAQVPGPSSHVPSLYVPPKTIPSLPDVQAPVEATPVQQQPAVTLPLQATQGNSSTSHVSSLYVPPKTIPSLPDVHAPVEATPVQQQQPAVTLPLQAIQDNSSTSDQTFTPLPSTPLQASSGNALPVIAGDFSLSIFKQTATSSSPCLSEDANESSEGLFSSPPSPSPPEDVNDSSTNLFSAPSSPAPSKDANESFTNLFSAPSSPTPSKDANESFTNLFSAPSSPAPSKDANESFTNLLAAQPSIPSDDGWYSLYMYSAPPSPC